MATTETVKIVFEVDNKAVTDTVQDLAALGKVSQEDAAKFKQLSDASKAASKDIAAVGKSAAEVGKIGQEAQKSSEGFVSLRTQLKQAKDELARLSDEFGDFSPQANAARARAGELADELSDLNRQVNLLNPESKIQAFSAFGSGVVGAFQVATGALQAFGAENEEVQQIASKLQGALNVVQGVQSIVQLKEAYQDVKAVLGFTTVAQQTLTTATAAGTVATNAGSVAARGFAAALTSTGIGAIVVAIGALAGAFLLLRDNEEEATEEAKDLVNQQAALAKLRGETAKAEEALAIASGKTTKFEAARKASQDKENAALQEKRAELNRINQELQAERDIRAGLVKQGLAEDDLLDGRVKASKEKIRTLTQSQDILVKQITEIEKTGSAERQVIDIDETEFKKGQADKQAADRKRAQDQIVANQKAAAAQSIAIEQDRLKQLEAQYNQEYRDQIAAIDDELQLAKSENAVKFFEDDKARRQADLQSEQDAIDKRLEVLTNFNLQNSTQFKLLVSQRALLSKQLADKETSNSEESNKKQQKADQETYDAYVALGLKYQKEQEQQKKNRLETIEFGLDFASDATDFLVQEAQRESDEKIARLEEQKKQGLISEEEYQAGLKKIKQKNAEDTKKFNVFSALLQTANAIINALNTPANPLDPTAIPRAVAFAAITGAANLAKILATPIPKFQQGTLSVPGQDFGRDSVYAMLRPGEAVIPTETNRAYAPTIEAIYRKRIKPSEINAFVLNRMTGKGSIGRDTAVTASVDTFALSKAMSKQKTVEVGNARTVGKAIAGEILKAYNPRRA
jgi:hypothetical protein